MIGRVYARWSLVAILVFLGVILFKSNVLVTSTGGFNSESIPIYDESRKSLQQVEPVQQMQETREKQREIENAIKSSWLAYSTHAFESDVYMPLSKKGRKSSGLRLTMLDGLDTIMMAGMTAEVEKVRNYLATVKYKEMDVEVNVYEAISRGVGGLLGAYAVSKDPYYAKKAIELAERVLPAINTTNGVPAATINLKTSKLGGPKEVPISEVGSLQLELQYLGNLTLNHKYFEAATRFSKHVESQGIVGGLVPDRVNKDTGNFVGKNVIYNMGQGSYYGNILRQDILTSFSQRAIHSMAEEILGSIQKEMVEVTSPSRYKFLGSLPEGVSSKKREFITDQDTCALAGLLAFHSTNGQWYRRVKAVGISSKAEERYRLGLEMLRSCAATWLQSTTGIAPYRIAFNIDSGPEVDFKTVDARNIQTSGVFEALYEVYRVTADPLYREWGWEMFTALRTLTQQIDGSFCMLHDVFKGKRTDAMSPSWIGGTLKFLWLLFEHRDAPAKMDLMCTARGHCFPQFEIPTRIQWAREHPVKI